MRIRKESGGTTITHRNARYEWPEDGSVTDVPPDLAADLLGIRGGGYSEAPEPEPEGEFSEVDPGDGDGDADPGDDGEEKPEKAPRKPRGKSVTDPDSRLALGGAVPGADSPVPLCTVDQFTKSAFGDLVAKWSPQARSDLVIEATRICEGEAGGRRLAPFTITETTRADAIDPDEYPPGADMPMPIQGTIGWSQALALGGNDLVRHCWLSQYPVRYPDLWQYSDVSVTVIRSYAGTETLQQAQILDGPDNTGHLWFQIGTLVPVGSRIRNTYSGGFRSAVPADLVRAAKLVSAWLAIGELNPGSTDHDPDKLYTDALLILANYARA